MRWLLFCLILLSIPASALAQDCPDGTPEGANPMGDLCRLCRGGVIESLPPRTVCADDRTFACDSNGAYRDECVLMDENDPDGPTTCMERVPKGPACPNGLTCDTTQMLCRTFCLSAAECQTGFECVDERCVRPEPPDMGMPDMGGGDMGGGDMGGGEDMSSEPDMESSDMSISSVDVGRDDGSSGTKPRDDESGCCAVIAARPSSNAGPLLTLLLALIVLRRRHA